MAFDAVAVVISSHDYLTFFTTDCLITPHIRKTVFLGVNSPKYMYSISSNIHLLTLLRYYMHYNTYTKYRNE